MDVVKRVMQGPLKKLEAGAGSQKTSDRRVQSTGEGLDHVYGDTGCHGHDLAQVPLADARPLRNLACQMEFNRFRG